MIKEVIMGMDRLSSSDLRKIIAACSKKDGNKDLLEEAKKALARKEQEINILI